jgi:hypothetical protein
MIDIQNTLDADENEPVITEPVTLNAQQANFLRQILLDENCPCLYDYAETALQEQLVDELVAAFQIDEEE